ncbi:Uncharacterised protein [Mycobacteroides abscessus subsp. abscessus]|nr:Uncharacterised protein [Mycobacteroides abscessus subsp. abscessus]
MKSKIAARRASMTCSRSGAATRPIGPDVQRSPSDLDVVTGCSSGWLPTRTARCRSRVCVGASTEASPRCCRTSLRSCASLTANAPCQRLPTVVSSYKKQPGDIAGKRREFTSRNRQASAHLLNDSDLHHKISSIVFRSTHSACRPLSLEEHHDHYRQHSPAVID